MTILSYSRSRLQIAILVAALVGLGFVIRLGAASLIGDPIFGRNAYRDVKFDIVLPLLLALTCAAIWRFARLMNGDLQAIGARPEGLEVTGLFGRRTVAWDSLLAVHNVTYWFGLYRVRKCNIRYLQEGATKVMRVPLVLARQPHGGHMTLPDKVEAARAEALGRPYAPGGERIEGTGLDPDAAIARYLKAKAEAAAAGAGPAQEPRQAPAAARPRPAFGRKGLG